MADSLVKPEASCPPRLCDLRISYHRKRHWWELCEEGKQSPNALAAKERRPELGTCFTQQGEPSHNSGRAQQQRADGGGCQAGHQEHGTNNLTPNTHVLNWLFNTTVSGIVVQSLSRVQLFATPWTADCQAPLFFTISQSLLKLIVSGIKASLSTSLHRAPRPWGHVSVSAPTWRTQPEEHTTARMTVRAPCHPYPGERCWAQGRKMEVKSCASLSHQATCTTNIPNWRKVGWEPFSAESQQMA